MINKNLATTYLVLFAYSHSTSTSKVTKIFFKLIFFCENKVSKITFTNQLLIAPFLEEICSYLSLFYLDILFILKILSDLLYIHFLLLIGQAAFLPKYLESQFSLTASHAAMIVGSVVVPAGAAGTLLGKV